MDLISPWNIRVPVISSIPGISTISRISFLESSTSISSLKSRFQHRASPFRRIPNRSLVIHAKKKRSLSESEPVPKRTVVEEILIDDDEEEEEQLLFDEFDNELSIEDDDYFEDEFLDNETELYAGDGGGGGGIKLAGTWWDETALEIAEEVCRSFDGDLGIYAFKTLMNSTIQVRIERLTNESGSPNMQDIETFSTTYRKRLDEAQLAKSIPENISLEVSSPGVERVVRIPQDLDRFKDRAMYVRYISKPAAEADLSVEGDGIFRLVSFDLEAKQCTWGLADVKVNREKAGKGRPLNKKQREWRLDTGFDSLLLVRLHSDC